MQSSKPFIVGSVAALALGGMLFEVWRVAPHAPVSLHAAKRPIAKTVSTAVAPDRANSAAAQSPASAAAEDPLSRRDEGYRRITALQKSGDFAQAAGFAVQRPDEFRRDWIIAAYFSWGKSQPEAAASQALGLTDTSTRELALQSAFSGWAHADPEGLAEVALNRPDGPEKNSALTKAIREWLHRDPEKVGNWVASHEAAIPVVEKLFRDEQR